MEARPGYCCSLREISDSQDQRRSPAKLIRDCCGLASSTPTGSKYNQIVIKYPTNRKIDIN